MFGNRTGRALISGWEGWGEFTTYPAIPDLLALVTLTSTRFLVVRVCDFPRRRANSMSTGDVRLAQ